MQPTENFHVPRRALDVEDYIDILRRHKGWIFGPFLLTMVASVVGVYLWPDSYDSVAVVSIRPQQISEQLVRGSVNQDIVDRINALSQTVMSRNELTNLIRNLNLYPRERSRMPTEDVLELMKDKIRISPTTPVVGGRNVPAFQLSFSYANRHDAQKVVSALVSKFIDENIKNRDRATYQQEDFLRGQAEEAKKRLDEIDGKLTQFKLANPGKLPDQMNANLAQMQAMQNTLLSLQNAISRATSEKMQLEQNVRIYQNQITALERDAKVVVAQATVQARAKAPRLVQTENQVEQLQLNLTAARKQYTEAHPEVIRLRQLIDVAQQQMEKVQAEEAAKEADIVAKTPANAPPISTPAALAAEREIRNYQASIDQTQGLAKAKDLEMTSLERQSRQVSDTIAMLNARVQAMPVGDQAWTDMMREQALAKDEYLRMSQGLQAAKVAADMEGRKQGETLELLDAATLATEPTDPNRPLVISIGAGLGLVLGLVLAGAREMKDTSLKNLKDVRAYTQMPILGSVPLLENDFVLRRRRRIQWLSWTVACLFAAVVMAGSIVYYYATKA